MQPPARASSPRPRELSRRSSRREITTIDPLQTLLSETRQPALAKKTSSRGLQTQNKPSRNDIQSSTRESRHRFEREFTARVPLSPRLSFAELSDIDHSADEDVVRAKGTERVTRRKSSTPFFRRTSDSRGVQDEDYEDGITTPKASLMIKASSRGLQVPIRRKSSINSTKSPSHEDSRDDAQDREIRRVGFMDDVLPGDSSDEDTEVGPRGRGRERERGRGKRRSTPFVRRRLSSVDDGESDPRVDGAGPCDRCAALRVLSVNGVSGVDIQPGN